MSRPMLRAAMRWIIAAFFAAAGIAHLIAPDKLLVLSIGRPD